MHPLHEDDNASEGSSEGSVSSVSSCSFQNNEIEDKSELQADIDTESSNETTFSYQDFAQIELPDIYKRNFADLAWKARCNVSDNAYDQMKYTKDNELLVIKGLQKAIV